MNLSSNSAFGCLLFGFAKQPLKSISSRRPLLLVVRASVEPFFFLAIRIRAHSILFVCLLALPACFPLPPAESVDSTEPFTPDDALVSDALRTLDEAVPFNPLFPVDSSEQVIHHAAIRRFLPAWRGSFDPKVMVDWLGVRTNQKWDCGGHNGGRREGGREGGRDGWREGSIDRSIGQSLGGWTPGPLDPWTAGPLDRWTPGLLDPWTPGWTHTYNDAYRTH